LKIDALESVPYALRFRDPYVTARGRLERRELLLVGLHAGGLTGLGEAAPLLLRGGPSLAELARELDGLGNAVEGREVELERPLELELPGGVSAQARAAIELALLDLAGKAQGRPAWSVLGAAQARPVPCNATLVAGEPSAVAAAARRWSQRGFTTFKLKMGVEGDVDQAKAVRGALGPAARIRVDANAVWSVDEAVAKLTELGPLDVELAEQPVATLADMASVRQHCSIPIAADESVWSAASAHDALAAEACDLATVKIAKVGGVRAALDVATVVPVYLSSALDGPVGIAAAAHLAQTLPRRGIAAGLAHGLATAELFAETIASRECRLENAALHPGDGPGWGVEIDESALERARL
jgi:o-succinylbenzoate synthase